MPLTMSCPECVRTMSIPCLVALTILLVGCAGNSSPPQPLSHEPPGPPRPDHYKFQTLLTPDGGWYDIQWDEDGLGVRVKHDIPEFARMIKNIVRWHEGKSIEVFGDDEPQHVREHLWKYQGKIVGPLLRISPILTFVVRRSSEGSFVTVNGIEGNPVWEKGSVKTGIKFSSSEAEHEIERLASKLLDAFNGS
jgi:hypothetical protein